MLRGLPNLLRLVLRWLQIASQIASLRLQNSSLRLQNAALWRH